MEHSAPKDQEDGVVCYLLANNNEEVYDYIRSEPESVLGGKLYCSWEEYESDKAEKEFYLYDEEGNTIKSDATYREKIIHDQGELQVVSYDDLYYGQTAYYWTLFKENVDVETLKGAIQIGLIRTL